jgi:hypothetical protein
MEIAHEVPAEMSAAWMVVLAAAMLLAAVYAHLQIPRYTAGTARIARAVLIVVGVGLGAVSSAIYAEEADTTLSILAFLIGFGVVHVPAAFILLLKRLRGTGKS